MFELDWGRMFAPSGSLLELFIRGSVIYLSLFAVMRFLPRREVGGLGASDVLLIVLIADAVQAGMAGRYESITEALVLAGTIYFWATVIDIVDFRYPGLRLSEGRPIAVIRNGRILRKNLERQKVTEDEVMAQLRQHGYRNLGEVIAAYIEGDGHFSVLGRKPRATEGEPPSPPGSSSAS
jgi:uncharacterized membrane protein YcaP (DUF421 family)